MAAGCGARRVSGGTSVKAGRNPVANRREVWAGSAAVRPKVADTCPPAVGDEGSARVRGKELGRDLARDLANELELGLA